MQEFATVPGTKKDSSASAEDAASSHIAEPASSSSRRGGNMRPVSARVGKGRRRGAALTELLIMLPVLLTIFFGSIEACNLLFLQQAVTESAYDGALHASRTGVTRAEVEQRVSAILAARGITFKSMDVGNTLGDIETVPPGELFTVTVRIDTASHLISPTFTAGFSEIEVSMTARKQ